MNMLGASIRMNYGLFIGDVIQQVGVTFSYVSLVLAVGQFLYGLIQPVFGILVEKWGISIVLGLGAFCILGGMLAMPYASSAWTIMLCLGITLPIGTGIVSYGFIMMPIAARVSTRQSAWISGVMNAMGGLSNIIMSPVIASLLVAGGLAYAMPILAIPMALLLPGIWILCRKPQEKMEQPHISTKPRTLGLSLIPLAIRNQTYIILMAGFFTCGVHMALIMSHLPTDYSTYGFSKETISYALSVFGMMTVIGSLGVGFCCRTMQLKNVLAWTYALRPLSIILYLVLPKTVVVILGFAALLGISGVPTVSPVAELIHRQFGAASIATLFGFVMLIHQIGGFVGAWLGGIVYDMTGTYHMVWLVDGILAAGAAGISFCITEKGDTTNEMLSC